MMLRPFLIAAGLFGLSAAHAQSTVAQPGKPFVRAVKNATGDMITVVDGVFGKDGRALLYVEEGLTQKVVRLDAQLVPAEELVLKDVLLDGLKWNGVAPIVDGGALHCLLVSNGKKAAEYGIGTVSADGSLSLTGFRRITSFEQLYSTDPTHTLVRRPQPDPILFSMGLAFSQQERIIRSADGAHYLLNHCSHNGKANKRFFFACLGSDFSVQWSGSAELPYEDVKSSIHQISLADDGTIHLLTYVFQCKTAEQLGDKNCHELHLTTISEQGKTVKDILLEKDFVSSARFCERSGGRVALAIRYGALTGQPGVVVTFDPTDPKLKPTPLVDQRLPSIHKTKLFAYGNMDGEKKTTISRTAKLPDEIVDLLPSWDGGLLVVETYLDNAYQIPMGDAIAIRRLCGPVRTSYIAANDSIKWQREVDRAFMTTAGQAYETVGIAMNGSGVTLTYDHTPRGMGAIVASGNTPPDDEKKGLDGPAEAGVLKATMIDRQGAVVSEGTALMNEGGYLPCPMGVLFDATGQRALVKSYDRTTTYTFTAIDLSKLGK
ncbi:MAG: hypothetical protein ABI432_05200 [Flavobacteriales bacterium]